MSCARAQTWQNNMSKTSEPKIKFFDGEDFTCVTFQPDLSKFKMEKLDTDTVALLTRRAYDVAGSCKGVKVTLNGKKLAVSSSPIQMHLPLMSGILFKQNKKSGHIATHLHSRGFVRPPSNEARDWFPDPVSPLAAHRRQSVDCLTYSILGSCSRLCNSEMAASNPFLNLVYLFDLSQGEWLPQLRGSLCERQIGRDGRRPKSAARDCQRPMGSVSRNERERIPTNQLCQQHRHHQGV